MTTIPEVSRPFVPFKNDIVLERQQAKKPSTKNSDRGILRNEENLVCPGILYLRSALKTTHVDPNGFLVVRTVDVTFFAGNRLSVGNSLTRGRDTHSGPGISGLTTNQCKSSEKKNAKPFHGQCF